MQQLISFMGANFVARESGYGNRPDMTNWGRFDARTQEVFRPLETYRERLGGLLDEISGAGFTAFDLWTAHLHPLWATPEHLAIFKEETTARKLRISSLAAVPSTTPTVFRAGCRMAAELNIPILGTTLSLLENDRDGVVGILREFGLILALENHPEQTPEELLQRLGEGDEDVLKIAVDTGWFGTLDYPADRALEKLADRLGMVHLKDIEGAGKHVTTALGKGIVPVESCLEVLVKTGYTGPISIEHEPFDRNPLPEIVEGRKLVEAFLNRRPGSGESPNFKPVGMAILGCGNIARRYVQQLQTYPEVQLLGLCDIDPQRARDLAGEFNFPVYETLEELLADDAVEVVVNLSIHQAHFETTSRCLESGKHVHTEKPLAIDPAQARSLVELADSRRLRLSSAPTTWLGEAQQTAWAWLEAGKLGTPRVAYAEANWGRIESWHPNPGPFYEVGPVLDVAVYPITLLTTWFGPVREVIAGGGIVRPERTTLDARPFTVRSEDWTSAVLTFQSGIKARLTSSFYVSGPHSQGGLSVHGDDGSLRLQSWDIFDAPLEVGKWGEPMQRVPLARPGASGIEFARGARDLAIALREDRPHRCTGFQAAHVVEVCQAILNSVRDRTVVEVHSDFPSPEPMEWARDWAAFLRQNHS